MILGAGIFQLPAIRKAVDLGYYVITVDYLPDNVGHKISHQYVNCSTTDRECVLQAAKELQIDGICTFSSDIAIPTVGYVADSLGLPGVSTQAAEIMATKNLFRAFQQKQGFDCPRFIDASSFDEVEKKIARLKLPIIFKPVDTSGSRGLVKIESLELDTAKQAFDYARSFSRSGTVCVEELIEGIEVGGDGILLNGKFAFIAITQKYLNNFVVTGHRLPTNISEQDRQRAIASLEVCCNTLNYTDGPLNFDVMVSPDKISIIEMSARNGGNGIPSIIHRGTGIDLEVSTLKLALKDSLTFSHKFDSLQGSASFIFGSSHKGVLKNITCKKELCQEIPEIFEMYLAKKPNEDVLPLEHNGNMIGYVLFDCKNSDEYQQLISTILQTLQIEVMETESYQVR